MKKLFGKFVYGLGNVLSLILNFIIGILEWVVGIAQMIGKRILLLLVGGCAALMFFPVILALLLHPAVFPIVLIIFLTSVLGKVLISFLRYASYVITEFLKDYGEYLQDSKNYSYRSFHEFSKEYQRMQEEEQRQVYARYEANRREQARREQEAWEEMFNRFSEEFRGGQYGKQGGYYDQSREGQYAYHPGLGFKEKYEEACDILGVNYNADKYEIKLAFRKKAKIYHPDVNKAPDATAKFQKINDAYAFLNDENIKRYQAQ